MKTVPSMQKEIFFKNEMDTDPEPEQSLLLDGSLHRKTVECGCCDACDCCTCFLASFVPCLFQYKTALLVQKSNYIHPSRMCIGDPNVPLVFGAIGCFGALLSGQAGWLGPWMTISGAVAEPWTTLAIISGPFAFAEPLTTLFQRMELTNDKYPNCHSVCQSFFCGPCLISQNLVIAQEERASFGQNTLRA
jgi:hypothetical protein